MPDNSLLLATLDEASTLRVYDLHIEWNLPAEKQRPPPPGFQLDPNLRATCIKIEPLFCPDFPSRIGSSTQFTKLVILSPDIQAGNSAKNSATIAAIFCAGAEAPPNSRSYSSRLVEIAIETVPEPLHPTFQAVAKDNGRQVAATSRVREHFCTFSNY